MSKSTISNSLELLSNYPWKSALFVILVMISLVFNLFWVWGAFWIWWAFISARAGEIVFLDVVTRIKHPYLFWIIIVTWVLIAASYFHAGSYTDLLEY